jgi:hypothetical protein
MGFFYATLPPAIICLATPDPTPHFSPAEDIIATAKQYVGWKYVWGGSQPSSGGFDCSGLVQYVYGKNGVRLPRVAEDQYQVGTPIRYENLQPGDLIFLANTYKQGISHVGIYIGNGQMLHAKGKAHGIVISPVGPFGAGHPGARRVLGGAASVRNNTPYTPYSNPVNKPVVAEPSVAFLNPPAQTVRGVIRLTVGHDPVAHSQEVEYAIEVDGEEAVVMQEAGVIVRFDTALVADGEHVVKLVRRNPTRGTRFVAQTIAITTGNNVP